MAHKFPKRILQIPSPEGKTLYEFDVDFMVSNYRCIFGEGCPGGWGSDRIGCCHVGAYFDDEDDIEKVRRRVNVMDQDDCDNIDLIRRKGFVAQVGTGPNAESKTRVRNGQCVFYNQDQQDAGGLGGCSLHAAALRRGEDPIDWKPKICSRVPLWSESRDDDDGHEHVTVTSLDRHTPWGKGEEIWDPAKSWWCGEEPAAYVGQYPVYLSMKAELVEICGELVYQRLCRELDAVPRTEGVPVQLKRRVL